MKDLFTNTLIVLCLIQTSNRLVNLQQLDIKHQLAIGRNGRRISSFAISSFRINDQLSSSSLAHRHDAIVPSLDHITHTDLKHERLLRLIEDVLVGQGSNVFHRALRSLAGRLALSDLDVLIGNILADLLDASHLMFFLFRALVFRRLGLGSTFLYKWQRKDRAYDSSLSTLFSLPPSPLLPLPLLPLPRPLLPLPLPLLLLLPSSSTTEIMIPVISTSDSPSTEKEMLSSAEKATSSTAY